MSAFEQARGLFLEALSQHQAGRFAEAESLYRRAHALMPERVSILANLATVLLEQQRPNEALGFCERALAVEPDHADVLATRALCLQALAGPAQALAALERALRADPGNAAALNHRGMLLADLGRFDEALEAYGRALAGEPGNAALRANRAALLARVGRAGDALEEYRQALRIDPSSQSAGLGFMHLVIESGYAPGRGDREFEALAIAGMRAPWAKPAAVAAVLLGLLRSDPAMTALLDPRQGPRALPPETVDALAGDRLLAVLLEGAPVPDEGFERFAIALRGRLLEWADAGGTSDSALLALHCALAMQCHLNDHVYAAPAGETATACRLRDRLQAALVGPAPAPPPAHWLPAVASYLPLAALPGAAHLLAHPWPEPVARLLDRTVREPLDERRRQSGIRRLTPVVDAVSSTVREQYEQNPYPKWPALARPARTVDLAEYVRNRVPGSDYRPRHAPGRVEVLNAGCGTGQQPIDTTLRLAGARTLAVDLSLASLAYGARMAERLGVRDLEFAQADILELGALERRFDLIESTGVLHHLAHPAQGLRVLAALLAPGGAIRLALYSESARQGVVAARELIARYGLRAVPEDIQRCREAIAALPDGATARRVMAFSDFYSLNECRDLLFHVQEHRFDLPGVGVLLAEAGLRLLGFELEPTQHSAFAREHPHSGALSSLDAWMAFEARHPDFFSGMYHVWATAPED
jgi:tetratricopeptide (TPR) repeat protein/SAM-dependent methyltransferase